MTRDLLAFLLDVTLKGVLVLLLVFGWSFVFRHVSASRRRVAWSLAVAGLVVLPFLVAVLPSWHLPVLPYSWPLAPEEPWIVRASHPSHEGISSATPLTSDDGSKSSSLESGGGMFSSWTGWVVIVWAAGAVMVLGRGCAGALGVHYFRRESEPLRNESWGRLLAELCRQPKIRRHVTLLRSAGARGPMTWGLLQPVILLPHDCMEWNEEKKRLVLLHELAHVRHLDHLTLWTTRLACACHWWNPLVWVAAGRLRMEREQACDDRVLGHEVKPSDYATLLLEMAAAGGRWKTLWQLAALPVAAMGKLEARLVAVLDPSCDRRGLSPRAITWTAILAAAMWTCLAVIHLATPKEVRQLAHVQRLQEHGRTPLMLAVARGDAVQVRALLDHGVKVDESARDGATALMLSVMSGDSAMAHMLLDHGADARVHDAVLGGTPLMTAVRSGKIEIARMLIEKGAEINAADKNGYTSLMIASVSGHVELMKLLLEHGADANARAGDGFTALLGAVGSSQKESVEILLKWGADVNAKDAEGWTALKLAKQGGEPEIAKLLLKAGAKDA